VGTGEACIRGNISHGDGIYKTLDGGKTWKNVGLRDNTRAIGKLIVHPEKSRHRVCGRVGHPIRAQCRARIFRTMDGGKDLGESAL